MNVWFSSDAWQQLVAWLPDDLTALRRILDLIEDVRRNPFKGLGKPEPLRGDLAGWWSRRITDRHRLVYHVRGRRGEDQQVAIIQCREHY